MDYHFKFVATYVSGTPEYSAPRTRGTCDVWHDNKRYVYIKNYYSTINFKNDICASWDEAHGTRHRITGVYPSYKIQVK